MKLRSKFTINRVDEKAVYITDDCDRYDFAPSVTNDAENVTQYLFEMFGNKQIFYKDTVGDWDELVHDKGVFKDFKRGVNLI